jgi:serine/threonine protein kinase
VAADDISIKDKLKVRKGQCPRKKSKSILLFSSGFVDVKFGPDSFISERAEKFSNVYTVINQIGQGGYAKVYKVVHKNTRIVRAMKSKRC